jgi:hypothetical protein
VAVASKALVIIRKEGSTLREVTRFRDGLWQRHYPNAHLKSHTIQERNPSGVRLRFWAGCSTIIVRKNRHFSDMIGATNRWIASTLMVEAER